MNQDDFFFCQNAADHMWSIYVFYDRDQYTYIATKITFIVKTHILYGISYFVKCNGLIFNYGA